MAHNLSKTADGRTTMMYVGEKPWHGLGTKLKKAKMIVEHLEDIKAFIRKHEGSRQR